jgi:hypothetical protein
MSQDELPGWLLAESPRRRKNKTASARADEITLAIWLYRSEREELKWNVPGPSGQLGGYQVCENKMISGLDAHPETTGTRYRIDLDEADTWQLVRYIQRHKQGGPNERLRRAFRRWFGTGEEEF